MTIPFKFVIPADIPGSGSSSSSSLLPIEKIIITIDSPCHKSKFGPGVLDKMSFSFLFRGVVYSGSAVDAAVSA
jgi:hypothetical protein